MMTQEEFMDLNRSSVRDSRMRRSARGWDITHASLPADVDTSIRLDRLRASLPIGCELFAGDLLERASYGFFDDVGFVADAGLAVGFGHDGVEPVFVSAA